MFDSAIPLEFLDLFLLKFTSAYTDNGLEVETLSRECYQDMLVEK